EKRQPSAQTVPVKRGHRLWFMEKDCRHRKNAHRKQRSRFDRCLCLRLLLLPFSHFAFFFASFFFLLKEKRRIQTKQKSTAKAVLF
ncbi:MAG: hypothetical protein IJF24_01205, partial [Clostridia bacterium]|nr:hypothetical protein [Clostridia bacterium]